MGLNVFFNGTDDAGSMRGVEQDQPPEPAAIFTVQIQIQNCLPVIYYSCSYTKHHS